MGLIISMCDETGIALLPWTEAGHECIAIDIKHSIRKPAKRNGILYLWGDARSWAPPSGKRADFFMAWPPCTDTAVSGARDFVTKGLSLLVDALELFNACYHAAAWSGAPYQIEQPVGVLSTHIRKPDHTFDPCDYGDPYTKKTCLWTGNGFIMPPKNRVEPAEGSKMHMMAPSPDRASLRSATPVKYARAIYEANKHLVKAVVRRSRRTN